MLWKVFILGQAHNMKAERVIIF